VGNVEKDLVDTLLGGKPIEDTEKYGKQIPIMLCAYNVGEPIATGKE
tara:strand:+ start:617 stop:757 length:141 start_codon:yes stop_codon:yes gene_type:complete